MPGRVLAHVVTDTQDKKRKALSVIRSQNRFSEKYGKLFVAEINYDILKTYFNDKIVFKAISKFPSVERDLAVIIDNSVSCESIVSLIKKSGGEYLESVKLFDIYKGEQIAKDKKSLAFNLVFQALDRTLNVEEIDEVVKNILLELRNNVNAELR